VDVVVLPAPAGTEALAVLATPRATDEVAVAVVEAVALTEDVAAGAEELLRERLEHRPQLARRLPLQPTKQFGSVEL
jgi:hypothetical protein